MPPDASRSWSRRRRKTNADVVYLLIDSSADRPKETIIEQNKSAREKFEIKQPMLVDHDGKVGRLYGARTTPHMFVIDGEGVLQYSGAFGDKRVKEDWLREQLRTCGT